MVASGWSAPTVRYTLSIEGITYSYQS
ncbi:hypothetical protein FAGKG844_160083 [Frankia sp. AgKG'84/4]